MEKYDQKFYDYLVLNQNNSDIYDGGGRLRDNTTFKKLQMINATNHDSFNKRSNNLIWMFFYFFLLIILIIMVFLFV
tara:strand:+ start:946 stop:1176 length:231 start_codon:yes stop_codon:yes gene_type:complete